MTKAATKPTKKTAPKKTAPKRKPAPKKPEPRKTTCRICKARIEFSTGMSEIEQHWQDEHPQQLAALRRNLGHDQPSHEGGY